MVTHDLQQNTTLLKSLVSYQRSNEFLNSLAQWAAILNAEVEKAPACFSDCPVGQQERRVHFNVFTAMARPGRQPSSPVQKHPILAMRL